MGLATGFLTINVSGLPNGMAVKGFQAAIERSGVWKGTRGSKALTIARFKSKDSISKQFDRQETVGFRSRRSWPKRVKFGSRRFSAIKSNAVFKAWVGKSSATYRPRLSGSGNTMTWGVNEGALPGGIPWVRIYQGLAGRRIKAKKMITSGVNSGRSKMQAFLGLTYGVWLSDSYLRNVGILLPPRRVDMNAAIQIDIEKMLLAEYQGTLARAMRAKVQRP